MRRRKFSASTKREDAFLTKSTFFVDAIEDFDWKSNSRIVQFSSNENHFFKSIRVLKKFISFKIHPRISVLATQIAAGTKIIIAVLLPFRVNFPQNEMGINRIDFFVYGREITWRVALTEEPPLPLPWGFDPSDPGSRYRGLVRPGSCKTRCLKSFV